MRACWNTSTARAARRISWTTATANEIPDKIQFPGYGEKWQRAVAADNGETLRVITNQGVTGCVKYDPSRMKIHTL